MEIQGSDRKNEKIYGGVKMRRTEIENQLKKELSVSSHSDFSKIITKCQGKSGNGVSVSELALADGGTRGRLGWISAIFGAFILVTLAMFFILYDFGVKPSSSGYFVIDINPSIKIAYDENGLVTEVVPLNEDASVLLVDLDLTSKKPDEAVDLLFEKCIQLGYFSPERENNAVLASATTDNGEKDEKMTEYVKELFSDKFSKKQMLGVVITGIENEELNAQASEFGIDSQKYALILSYSELGGALEPEKYSSVSISELYQMISDKEGELKKEEIKRIESERDNAISSVSSAMISHIEALIERLSELYSVDEDVVSALSLEHIFTELKRPEIPDESDSPIMPSKPEHDDRGEDDFDKSEPDFDKDKGEDEKSPEAPPYLEPDAPSIPDSPVSPSEPSEDDEENDEDKSANDSIKEIISKLEDILSELKGEGAKVDFSDTVSDILKLFDKIEAIINDSEVLKITADARAELVSFGLELDKRQGLLTELNKTFEEKSSARLEKFKNSTQGGGADAKKWQKEKEASVSASWNEYKKQWQSERRQDLK